MTTTPEAEPASRARRLGGRGQTRPEQAAQRLAAMAESVEPGERLGTKDELRGVLGVSVGTLNEALRVVQTRGLITVRPGPRGGLFASRQSPVVRLGNSMLALDDDAASVAEAVRLRNALDPLLVEDAIEHASNRDIKALRVHLAHMEDAAHARDSTAFVRANWALHARIAEISPSPILRSFYLNLLQIIEDQLLAVQPVGEQSLPEYVHGRFRLHADLVDAIASHDVRALDLIREHNTTVALSAGAPLGD